MDVNASQRVRQYANVDGLLELALGIVLFLIALTSVVSERLPSIVPAIIYLPLAIAIPLLFQGTLRLKQRVTYPRTGYAVPRSPPRHFTFIFFALLLLLTAVQGFFLSSLDQGTLLLLGVLMAGLLWWLGAGLVRFYCLAVTSLVLSIALTWLPLGDSLGGTIFCVALGLLLLTSGAYTLHRYLKSTTRER